MIDDLKLLCLVCIVAVFLAELTSIAKHVKSIDRKLAPACTHGVSSIGPVKVVGGKVTGNTTPSTEPCLP